MMIMTSIIMTTTHYRWAILQLEFKSRLTKKYPPKKKKETNKQTRYYFKLNQNR